MSHHELNADAAPAGTVLEVSGLTVGFRQGNALRTVVRDVSFSLRRGELLALVGESGSGKSVTALAIMGLLPEGIASVGAGAIRFDGQELASLSPEERRRLRGRRLSMIFQEPMTALNPVMPIGQQLAETLLAHGQCGRRETRDRAVQLLEEVGIPAAATRLRDYPHQLSGGQRQRVMIAMALACRPELLIADEPTTALDVTVQAQIMELLNRLRRQLGTAVLFITHNLALVREQADRVAVMVSGQLVETAPADGLFRRPCHPYTRLLLRSVPSATGRHAALAAIAAPRPGVSPHPSACAFATRCPFAQDVCLTAPPDDLSPAPDHHVRCRRPGMFGVPLATDATSVEPPPAAGDAPRVVLEARGLQVWFPRRGGLFGRRSAPIRAVDGVDLTLRAGETLALVGESGCGKTTVGKALVRLLRPTGGSVRLGDGIELTRLDERAMRPLRRRIQMIFQDPFSSLDPRLMAGESLLEGLDAQRIGTPAERRAAVAALLGDVGLPTEAGGRYPHQFSGGQRQRLGLARALAVSPDIIVCDECTSALDVSVQAQMLNLLRRLQRRLGLAYLFITHDLSVVSYFADRIAVMYLGRIVEEGPAAEVLAHPAHPYTRALLAAAPRLDGAPRRAPVLPGDLPSPGCPPDGCRFHPRCPHATDVCRLREPPRRQRAPGHWATCHVLPSPDAEGNFPSRLDKRASRD
ncbi:MAG: dipeptide ABC transporter ATP-binding protein [Oligosphaeraceae bacterium]